RYVAVKDLLGALLHNVRASLPQDKLADMQLKFLAWNTIRVQGAREIAGRSSSIYTWQKSLPCEHTGNPQSQRGSSHSVLTRKSQHIAASGYNSEFEWWGYIGAAQSDILLTELDKLAYKTSMLVLEPNES
ncbi:hypothetical protein SARC_00281, partial [Sphaeroforma arctica JP610]